MTYTSLGKQEIWNFGSKTNWEQENELSPKALGCSVLEEGDGVTPKIFSEQERYRKWWNSHFFAQEHYVLFEQIEST